MQNRQRPGSIATGLIKQSNDPASPGHNSYGKPFLIKLSKCGKAPGA